MTFLVSRVSVEKVKTRMEEEDHVLDIEEGQVTRMQVQRLFDIGRYGELKYIFY